MENSKVIPPPPPGFTEEVITAPKQTSVPDIEKVGQGMIDSVSRVAGILIGSANAPLAFIHGARNAPYHNQEEWDKLPWYAKPLANIAGGMESAYRSAAKKGDWGEAYDRYYEGKTGRKLRDDFGQHGSEYLKLGLDLLQDPMVGPMIGMDMSKMGVKTVGEFVKYVKSGATPAGAKEIMAIPKGTKEGLAEAQALDDAEKLAIREKFVQQLNSIKEKAQAEVTPEKWAAVYGQDAAVETPSVASLINKKFQYNNESILLLPEEKGFVLVGEQPEFKKPLTLDEYLSQPATKKEDLGWPEPGKNDTVLSYYERNVAPDTYPPTYEYDYNKYLKNFIPEQLSTIGKDLPSEGQALIRRAAALRNITIESERAASGVSNFQGKVLPMKVEEIDPELASKLDAFLGRKGEGYAAPIIIGEDATKFRAVLGSAAGIEQDAEGNWTYDPAKGAMGTVAMAGAFTLFKKPGARKGMVDTSGFSTEGAKVADMYQETIAAREKRDAITLKKVKDYLVRSFVDTSGNLKAAAIKTDSVFGTELQMKKELIPGASARASNMMQTYNEVIFDGLTKADSEILNTIIQSRRTVEIDNYKGIGATMHPNDLGGVSHLDYLDDLRNAIGPEKFADINARADIYYDAMLDQLTMMRDEGIISLSSFQNLSQNIYSPRQFMQYLDDIHTNVRGSKITVGEKQIKSLDEGSMELLMNNAPMLLNQQVHRTQDIIFRNRANVALHDFAEANPGNSIVQLAKIQKYTKDGKPVYQDTPGGFEKVSVQINGEHKEMLMPNEMAKEWVKNDPLVNQTLATFVQWGSGTAPLKATATGYNPAFALANLPRDIALIWSSTTEYSAHLPVSLGQMAVDLAQVAGDVVSRKGRVLDFINEGGSMDFLTYQGRFSGQGDVGEKLNSLGKYLGWVGETSELWTRMALRERSLKNGATPEQATWAARKYLDFSQGGNISKALDNGLPYLNAGIQGTRALFRAGIKDPALMAYKLAQVGTLAGGLYMANYFTNPDCWKQVTPREKEANFIITTPWSYTDSKGQERYLYFKIAKDQGQRSVTALIEGAMQYYFEGISPSKQMMMAVGDLLNADPIPTPPIYAAAAAAFLNKDTWSQEDIWKGPKVEAGQEYTPYTHPAVKMVGSVGLSPERTRAATGKIVAANNFYTGLVGWGTQQMFEGMDPDMAKKTKSEIVLAAPGINKILNQTSPYSQWKEDLDTARMDETTRRFKQSREVDKLAAAYFQNKDSAAADKIIALVEAQPAEDQQRLSDRVVAYSQTAQLPDRSWWVSVASMPYDARAKSFLDRYNKENEGGKLRMIELADTISGFNSDEFVSALSRMQGGNR